MARLRVLEVTGSWPCETFIERHIGAVAAAPDVDLAVAVRRRSREHANLASIGSGCEVAPVLDLPTFDGMSKPAKLVRAVRLVLDPRTTVRGAGWRTRADVSFLRKVRPDLVHFHWATMAGSMALAVRKLGIPYTVSMRGSDLQVFPLKSWAAAGRVRTALEGASRVHAVCSHLGEWANRLFPGLHIQPDVIYTAVPIPPSLPAMQEGRLDTPLRLLSVGRVQWRKALPDLLQALRALLDQGVDARLTLVGCGPDEDRFRFWVERLCLSTHIVLTGKLTEDQIRGLFQCHHAYVQSSVAEGLSNSLAEAMAHGCPVFATDAGGTAEVIRDGENGFILPVGEPTLWAEKLKLALDRSLMERMRLRAYETARELFSPERHAREFIRFYEDAVATFRKHGPPKTAEPQTSSEATEGSDPALCNPTILVCGTWEWQYGGDMVVRALAKVLPRHPEASCLILGDGPQEDEIRYLVHFFRIERQCRVLKGSGTWPPSAQVVINLDGGGDHWLVTRDACTSRIPRWDAERLRGCLIRALGER